MMRPAESPDVFAEALRALDLSSPSDTRVWAGALIRSITPHRAVARILILSGADHVEAARERVLEFAAEDTPRQWRTGAGSSIKLRGLAACAALQTGSPPLAGSGDGPAAHLEPVSIRDRIPVRADTQGGDRIVVAVEPGSTSTQREFMASALLIDPGTDDEPAASLFAAVTVRASCARCAVSSLRRVLETSLLLDSAPTDLLDVGPVMAWLAEAPAT